MKLTAKPLLYLAILAVAVFDVSAQNTAKNWVFGNRVRIDFNGSSPVASALPPGTINTWEGTASISDSSGNLLFYTDGMTVRNRNNNQMPNGFGLMGHNSSTNSAFIVPCSCGKYFIFTADAWENNYANGLRYSVVDMSLNGNLGDIAAASKNTLLLARASEKIAVVTDGDGGFWMVAHHMDDNRFYSYHIPLGDCTLSAPVISNTGTSYTDVIHGVGQIKISPDKTRLATALYSYAGTSFLELFQFNAATGAVSSLGRNPPRDSSTDGFYGVEFSPDSKALYATTVVNKNLLYRYDITSNTLTRRSLIHNFGTGNFLIGALQLAPDWKIYLARDAKNDFLSVLPAPNTAGGGWTNSRFPLAAGSYSRLGLPSMIAGYFHAGRAAAIR